MGVNTNTARPNSNEINPGVESGVVIVFTRYPEPGVTKTRLIPALGPTEACRVHRLLAEKTMGELRGLRRRLPLSVEVHFSGGDVATMAAWLGAEWDYFPQGEGDLGSRLKQAAAAAFRKGKKRVILIGTDCLELNGLHLQSAFESLDDHDLVIGPARDGGYYLLGLKDPHPELFHPEMPWGSDQVLPETLKTAERIGLKPWLLEPLADVDRPEDLSGMGDLDPLWRSAPDSPEISIIIPTLNEGPALSRTLNRIGRPADQEIIVVDGGSRDDTCSLAASLGARVLHSPPGRAVQMNRGADQAVGDLFLFLHADTLLPSGYTDYIRETLARPGVVAGAFRLCLEPRLTGLSLIEWMANLRAEKWHLPYGDQGLFLAAKTFRETGGYPQIPFMEDVEIVRRLRRRGKVALAPVAVITSARRWQMVGVWRNTLLNQLLLMGFFAGLSPERLSRWYRRRTIEADQD